MPSVEELLSVAEVDINTRNASDNRIEIDADTRIIQMMPQDELFGVESDEKSERKYFKVPKVVGNGVDLSKLQLRINYQNASKLPSGKDMYIVKDATIYNDEWVYFSWELSRKVTLYKGTVYFVVCAVKADSKGNIINEWNTTLAEGKVLEGLEVETSQEQQYQASDYLEQLKQQLLQYSKEIKETFPSDYTETVEDVKNLKKDVQKLDDNKITKFYTNNQGEKVLNDSDNGKIQDLVIYGKSEQAQYTGTNLLPLLRRPSGGYAGVTVTTKEDGTIVYNGTATKNIDYYLCGAYANEAKYSLDETKEYIIRKMPTGIVLYLGANSVSTKIITNSDLVTSGFSFGFVLLRCTEGSTFNNTEVKVQINEGTTLLDYEPYTGGKPSPSPEYPQEIKAVVNPVIKTHGTNLLDIKDVAEKVLNENGLTYSVQQGVIKVKGTATSSNSIGIKFMSGVNKKITVNNTYIFNPNPIKKVETAECYLDFTNNVSLGFSIQSNNIDQPKNVNENEAKYAYTLNIRVKQGAKIDMEWKPQLIISNTLLPYQPYQESQATLPYELYAIPVSSGGNVTINGKQYIADYVDVERGKLVRKTHVTKFTGAENWVYTDSDTESERRFGLPIYVKCVPHFGLSNYLRNADAIIIGSENAFVLYGSWVDVRIAKFTSLAEFKNFLSEINSSGKPLIVIYALATPEEINLTPEEIEAFKALSTYYPKTYINAESEQLNAYTMFNYPVSMEKGWEYVKQQISDDRKYIYDMDTKLTETEASALEAQIDTAILSEMVGG